MQNHLKTLEKCKCGALRYIALREKGKRLEIILLHIRLRPKRRTKQTTLASIRIPQGGFDCLEPQWKAFLIGKRIGGMFDPPPLSKEVKHHSTNYASH